MERPKFAPFRPTKRLLLGPGPSDVPRRVLDAMAGHTLGHLDPDFQAMMEELKTLLRYAFQTRNEMTMPVSGPGSAGMEMCFVNLVEPGDTVIICRNGVFGRRMVENVTRLGARPVVVDDRWGNPVDPDKVEEAFRQHPEAKTLAFVHAETSTGVQSDAESLARIAREHGALTIVDAVTSLAGTQLLTDLWGLDAVYAGSQKCLSCAPGLSPITFSAAAVERARVRRAPAPSWFLDLNLVLGYWGKAGARTYHHTAPVNALYGLHEALVMLSEEGLENSWARHRANHERLKAGLERLGLSLFVAEPYRLPQLNAVTLPAGVDDDAARRRLLDEFGIEIGAGLGELAGRIWRIGLMGHSSRPENVDACLAALAAVIRES